MAQEFSVVGKRLPRIDAKAKAIGATTYTVDLQVPRMLIGKVLHSPYPHAKIKKINKTRAEQLPGVVAVITFEDVPKVPFTMTTDDKMLRNPDAIKSLTLDQLVLNDKARFVGDPVAAVAAIDEGTAEQAIDLIEVEYEQLPAVFDAVEAMKPGAPQIHDAAKNNIASHFVYPFAQGNVEKGFAEADLVLEETFSVSKQHPCQMEPTGCVVDFDADGNLTIWSPTQEAFLLRDKMADIYGIPTGKVRYLTQFAGGSFGGRGVSLTLEPITAALSKKAGRPVKTVYTREEDLFALETRTPFIQTGKIGFKKDGTITAMETRAIANSGAYITHSPAVTSVNLGLFFGLYKCPNTSGYCDIVYTNIPISGGIRGYGNPQAMWVLEQMMDMAAEKLGIDPIEIRLKNLRETGDPCWVPFIPIEGWQPKKCIEKGCEMFGWKEKSAANKGEGIKRRGIGIATVSHVSGAFPMLSEHTNAYIKLNEDGSADLIASCVEMGQGLLTTLCQIAAEELGLRLEDIRIFNGDTSVTGYDVGQHASRSIHGTGEAVRRAAAEARKQLLERAAKMLGVSSDGLQVKDRWISLKDDGKKGISVAEVCNNAIHNLEGECLNISGRCSFEAGQSPIFQAVLAEVEVDLETGVVKPLKLIMVHDIGRAINPLIVEGQLEGGAVQSLGYALSEDFIVNKNNGVLESDNFTSYKVQSAPDVPEIEVSLVEDPVESGPFGAKSVGESATVGVPAAIGNAVYNAIGVRIKDLPITPEKVLKALKEKEQKA